MIVSSALLVFYITLNRYQLSFRGSYSDKFYVISALSPHILSIEERELIFFRVIVSGVGE